MSERREVSSKEREEEAWRCYLVDHEQILRRHLATVPWNCEVRATLSRMLELNVEAVIDVNTKGFPK